MNYLAASYEVSNKDVIPVKTGIQILVWIPASAGMTRSKQASGNLTLRH